MNFKEIEQFLISCCEASAVRFGPYKAVKYLCGRGTVIFFEDHRHLRFIEEKVPGYIRDENDLLDWSIRRAIEESDVLELCEADSYEECHYTYSVFMKDTF